MVINDDAGEAAENDNVFSDWRKVDKDGADTTLSGMQTVPYGGSNDFVHHTCKM